MATKSRPLKLTAATSLRVCVKPGERFLNLESYRIQLWPLRFVRVARRKLEAESVSFVAGKHVKVYVENFLPCRLTIR